MTEKAYAKLNLTLEVVGKKDGYHLLESIVVPINLFDTLTFVPSNKDEVISNIEIPNNNIYQAIDLFKQAFKIVNHVKVILDKRIPIGYGLGGSSADISATLRGLNKFFNINKPLRELEDLALKLGSDTLFCLYQKRAFVEGRGDLITFKEEKKKKYLLILPNQFLLTKEVFMNFNLTEDYVGFKDAFIKSDLAYINKNLKNDLLLTALKLNQTLNAVYQTLKNNGFKPQLTGSGPALFIENPTRKQIEKINQLVNKNALVKITKEI